MRSKRQSYSRRQSTRLHKKTLIFVLLFIFFIPVTVSLIHQFKDVPDGISMEGEIHHTSEFQFLYDLTYENADGTVEHEQEIFDTIYQLIDDAEEFIVVDMFLFNDDYDHTDPDLDFPNLSSEFADALIAKKESTPDLEIVFITDPINTFYGSYIPDTLERMTDSGIDVMITDLDPLRDSNPVYSGLYRSYLQWFGTSDASYLPNILRPQGPEINIRSYTGLLNFKANHRKIIMNEQEAIISSANPHDASSYHSNVAYRLRGELLNDLLESEKAVVEMSGYDTSLFDSFTVQTDVSESDEAYEVQLLTEGKIKEQILDYIHQATSEDAIKIGLFYLSDSDIIDALWDAQSREVTVQLILDINQDAFGNEKIGIPNRPVADELTKDDSRIEIRWYRSNGEQYHSKFFLLETLEDVTMIGGSTNFTRRNMDDFNLETNVRVSGSKDQPEIIEMLSYFDRLWENQDGLYTVDYTTHAESSTWKNRLYQFQEWSGLSTF
ncbi:MAG: phospholipase D family protein [Alkalibacterium sp.]|nr:phospholipase D family protein [Alkalibacterium sp.]